MQNPNGGTIQLVPQGLTVSPVTYQEGGPTLILQSQPAQTTVTTATQIEEAHSTTNHVSNQNTSDQDVAMENDKRAIYRHPLFPLMALLFEKCEQATQTPDCPSSDSFDVDIQAFVHHQEQDRKPFFSDDSELDGLMLKAIQVLRIHLLELEKVNELCKDFCQRYISCLKGKLQSENLLRSDTPGEGDHGDLMSPTLDGVGGNNVLLSSGGVGQTAGLSTLGHGQVVSGGTVYQMVQTPQGLVAQPIQIQSHDQLSNAQATTTAVIHGSTPLSQIGVASPPTSSQTNTVNSNAMMLSPDFDDDDKGKGKNSKRGVLPKHATQVMKSWLFQHIVHPYPTEDEKRQIASQINLSLLQVNNWFINARRRILQPMLDASNPEGSKAKKNKTPNRPVQRFWPDNIANLQPEVARAMASGVHNPVPHSGTADSQLTEHEEGLSAGEHTGESEEEDLDSQPNTPQPQHILLPPGVSLMPGDGSVYQNSGQMLPQMSQAQSSTPTSVHNGQSLANHAQPAPSQLHLVNTDSSNPED